MMPVSSVDANYAYPPPQAPIDGRVGERATSSKGVDGTRGAAANTESRYRPQGEDVKIYFFNEDLGQHVNVVV